MAYHACTWISTTTSRAPGSPRPISDLRFKFVLEKESRTYIAGEKIRGSLHILQLPHELEVICGMLIHLEGVYFNGSKNAGVKIVEAREYIIGSPWKTTDLKSGEYNFSITVPECSPCSYSTEKSTCMTYTLKLKADRLIKGLYTMRNEKTIIIANEIVQKCDIQAFLSTPLPLQRDILNGNIHLELNIDRKCYQPGDEIEFSLKTRNAVEKNISCISVQLQQNVKLSKQFDKNILVSLNNGPPVPKYSARNWSGVLEIPRILPSSDQDASTKNKTIKFQYCLTVTLKMAGSTAPSTSEEFPIQIGRPLVDALQSRGQSRSNSLAFTTSRKFGFGQLMRRTSLISLTPSLPDYNTALLRSVLPPAYSSLDLQDSLPSAPPLPEPSPSAPPNPANRDSSPSAPPLSETLD